MTLCEFDSPKPTRLCKIERNSVICTQKCARTALESARKYYALMKNPFTTSDLVEQIEKEFTGKATFGFSDELTERETHEQIKITYGRVLAKLEGIEKISANFTKTEWIGNL